MQWAADHQLYCVDSDERLPIHDEHSLRGHCTQHLNLPSKKDFSEHSSIIHQLKEAGIIVEEPGQQQP